MSTGAPGRVRRASLGLIALVALLASPPAVAQQIQGVLSNFDVHNENDQEMTNLELDLRNIHPEWVLSWYEGPGAWGTPPIVRSIGGTEVTWANFASPVQPGEMRHFGLLFDPSTPVPCGVQAYWTRHVKIVELPMPWQSWMPQPGMVLDLIRLVPEFGQPVLINREWSRGPRIPLEELNWDSAGAMLPWEPVPGDPIVLEPGAEAPFPVPLFPGDQAVYVRYTVAPLSNPENLLVRFVNEAEIEGPPEAPAIVGSLSNFDVHNDTGKPVHDLELELWGISPQDVWDFYRGADAWGLDPVLGAPLVDMLPDGSGTQIHWVDEWNPIPYSQTRHFGVRLNPWSPPPWVRAFWTRVVKDRQIPVPWQWWQTRTNGVVTDVIQLSDTFDEPVWIEREWATLRFPLPLDELVWDAPGIQWIDDPAGPVLLEPGDQAFLDILPEPGDGAVLVRYAVESGVRPMNALGAEVRFVNQAMLETPTGAQESAVAQQIIGTASNFDVINVTNIPYTNLELDFRDIKPSHIIDWYRGPMAWGLHPILKSPVISALPQTEVMWADFRDPLGYCETRHFGIELVGDAPPPCGVQAYWTQHRKVIEIPVPWQSWVPEPGGVVDVIRLNPRFEQPVWIQRQYATLPLAVPLDQLNWDNPEIPWLEVPGDPLLLAPGEELPLRIEVTPGDRAVLVRYAVQYFGPGSDPFEAPPAVRFVNEAEIETEAKQLPVIVGTLSNFDVHNDTGKPVHDLELDLYGVTPTDVWDWYRGPGAWGIDPLIRWTADGLATEVTWIDDRNPMQHCEVRHFGLRLNPKVQFPEVRAFWTRPVKVRQIPVPWQFWLAPGGGRIRDVVQLSDTFTGPVDITREWAVLPDLVPLDELNWDLAAPWAPDPLGTITLRPGFQADLDIPVDPTVDAAVVVRYTVVDSGGSGAVVTRFVNEAMLGPGVVSGLHCPDGKAQLEWNPTPLSSAVFDVVRGQLSLLRSNGGVQDASCLAEDIADPWSSDATLPASGDGFYYLVRSQSGAEHGTYDHTVDPTQREGRDAQIGPGDCL